MAMSVWFACSGCTFAIEAWSDGNPFYIGRAGKEKYAYHPDHEELAKCIANDRPHLCLNCGDEVKIDSREQSKNCPKCGSTNVVDTFALDNVKCPKCEDGRFVRDSNLGSIS
jgi:predicted RNA-binding Zn-ribbon protein involved in translation (DUF1610 family)